MESENGYNSRRSSAERSVASNGSVASIVARMQGFAEGSTVGSDTADSDTVDSDSGLERSFAERPVDSGTGIERSFAERGAGTDCSGR